MSVHIHNDVVDDLKAIRATDPVVFGRLIALLQQLKADASWIDRLQDHGYDGDNLTPVSVKKWHGAWRIGLPLWRIKFWTLERDGLQYRVIYLYDWRDKNFYVMAVVPRNGSFDYDDPRDPIRLRIARRCRTEFPGL